MQRVYKDLIRNFPKEGENIEDKKVDDKQLGELEEFLEELKRRG